MKLDVITFLLGVLPSFPSEMYHLCNIAVHFLGIFIKTQSKEVLCYGSVERRTHESTQKQEEESTCIYYGLRMCRCRLKQTPGTEATEAGELKQGRKQDSHCCQAAAKSEGGDGRAADPGAKQGPALLKNKNQELQRGRQK